jgi:hypothetical protein
LHARSFEHARHTGRNSEEAIERPIKEYDMPERERFQISVQREA